LHQKLAQLDYLDKQIYKNQTAKKKEIIFKLLNFDSDFYTNPKCFISVRWHQKSHQKVFHNFQDLDPSLGSLDNLWNQFRKLIL
jgi:hypothetical protein